MDNKTDYVRARISPDMKEAAEAIFAQLGLGHTEAIRLFYQQVINHRGIPFSLNIPNAETIKALKQVKSRKGLRTYKNAAEFRKSLGLDD